MIKINLNEDEKEILKKHYHSSKTRLIRERAHALLLNNQGKSVPQTADILFRSENTIREWFKSFNEVRISSIFTQYENNLNTSKLTKEQRKEIKEALNRPPSEYDIPKQFWDIKSLKKYLKAEFGIVYESERSYHFLFKISDFSFKLPSPFDVKRDNEYTEERMKEIKQEIERYLKDDKYENKNICIIWDNAKWHKSKEIRKELSKGNSLENFHLINLPPYAPDKNPPQPQRSKAL